MTSTSSSVTLHKSRLHSCPTQLMAPFTLILNPAAQCCLLLCFLTVSLLFIMFSRDTQTASLVTAPEMVCYQKMSQDYSFVRGATRADSWYKSAQIASISRGSSFFVMDADELKPHSLSQKEIHDVWSWECCNHLKFVGLSMKQLQLADLGSLWKVVRNAQNLDRLHHFF